LAETKIEFFGGNDDRPFPLYEKGTIPVSTKRSLQPNAFKF